MPENTHILIVDDHDLVLKGLKHVIESSFPSAGQVSTAVSGNMALTLAGLQNFDLVILDIELQDMSGFDLIPLLREKCRDVKIIVNTMHDDVWFVKRLLKSDVEGILFKSLDSSQMVDAIMCVLKGERYYCRYAREIKSLIRRSDENTDCVTSRELDVLKLISEGKVTSEIARELCVSSNTVDTHRRHLMEKLNVRNAAELVMTAISKGLISVRK